MKKISLLVLAFMLAVATGFADSGTYGSINWSIENNTLTLSGTGNGTGYPNPWDLRSDFQHVVIQDGITGLGAQSFYHCGENILTIDIPASVTNIDISALEGNRNLMEIKVHWTENIPSIDYTSWYGLIGIPADKVSGVKLSIPQDTFLQYQLASGWKDFSLEERGSAGINDMETGKTAVAYYSITGVQLQQKPEKGLYIILYDNGKAEKVVN
ncbi:MAG: leucine-rich repeat domain-containing protein [Prevotellaceae bacterium]|jgi:hypothetical protein|nr:leucine-rich repeat domain-containing protein [Prevotellaceae bacterium]